MKSDKALTIIKWHQLVTKHKEYFNIFYLVNRREDESPAITGKLPISGHSTPDSQPISATATHTQPAYSCQLWPPGGATKEKKR